jgi:hypothetical protein
MSEVRIAILLTGIEAAILDAALRQYAPSDPVAAGVVNELMIALGQIR